MLGARKWTVSLACVLLVAVVLVWSFPRPGHGTGALRIGRGRRQRCDRRLASWRQPRHHQQGTGLTREAVTDAAGHFTFPDLPAGVYG